MKKEKGEAEPEWEAEREEVDHNMQVIEQEKQSKSNDNDGQPKDKYIEKEEIEQQPDGQFRKIKYIYKEENQPNAQTKIESTKIEEKYSTEKQEKIKQIIQEERRESQNQQQINIAFNKEGSQKQSQKIQRSPKLHEEIKENIVKTTNLNQKEVNMQKEGDSQTKIYIKEVTYTENKNEGSPEKSNIRYIALKKREDQDVDEEDSQPQDEQPLDRREHPQEKKSVEDSKDKQQEPQLQSEKKYNEPKLRQEQQQLQKEEEKLNQQQENEPKKSEGKEEIQVQENEIQEQKERNVHEEINVQHEKEDYEVHSHEVEEEHQAGQDHEEQEEQEQAEGEEAELEGEEQVEGEEQMEGQEQEEEVEQENEDEEVPEDGQIERNSMNRPQVSSVEEIKGQNINFQNIQNMNNANINNIQTSQGTSNQFKIKAQIVQTQITKGNDQSKDLRSNIGIRRIQPISSLNNEQSRDPMMYSFGGKSSSATQNLGNSEIKNIDNVNNSDFLISSIKNNNLGTQEGGAALGQNSKLINQSGGYIMSNIVRVVSSSNREISEGERVTANFGGEINRNSSQSNQVRSSNKFSSSKREPVDGDSKKKQAEINIKQAEVSEFPLEPRDSKRKI